MIRMKVMRFNHTMMKVNIWMLTAIFFMLMGCKNRNQEVDVSDIDLQIKVQRFDKALFEVPHDSIWDYVPVWQKKYGNFFEAYNYRVIKIGGVNQLDYNEKLVNFLTDPYIENSYKDVQRVFKTLRFTSQLTEAFKRIKYYFPDKEIPQVYTHISGFNQSIVIDSGYISIALDKYLGVDTKYYSMLRIANYIRLNMHPQKITSDVVLAYLLTEFPAKFDNSTLLDQMIYYGSIQYAMDQILPQTANSLKWGISQKKLDWCYKNERKMWLYLVENKLLFSSDFAVIRRYIDDGPFTATFSKQSPAKTGQWLGYQIVKSYVKKHPEISLPELLATTDYQQILNQSKYKP